MLLRFVIVLLLMIVPSTLCESDRPDVRSVTVGRTPAE